MNKYSFIASLGVAVILTTFTAVGQNPEPVAVCEPQPCVNQGCVTQQPCYTTTQEYAPCYTPGMGCGYPEACNYPALVDRYAYLANKYNSYGPNERLAAIANNNPEVIELQKLDNHFGQNLNSSSLDADNQLRVRSIYGSIQR